MSRSFKIKTKVGLTFNVQKIDESDLPVEPGYDYSGYSEYYSVTRERDEPLFILGRGWKTASIKKDEKECVVWYENGSMWPGFAYTLKDALNEALINAYIYK